MLKIAPEKLRAALSQVLAAAGAPEASAVRVAASLVENNLVGHDSHGALRISQYTSEIASGIINPAGEIRTLRESATTACLDGGRNFGQIVARQAMQMAIDKARDHDLGWVAIRNCAHTGRLGEYTVQAAQQGMMGLAFSSGSTQGGIVAPFGGISRALNTNPLSWAVPSGELPILFLDMATSIVAQGKIVAAIDKGVNVPEGWLLDASGKPTTDPLEQRKGGVLLPFGAHKGSGLSVMIEMVAGGLAGTGPGTLHGFTHDYPTIVAALNVAAFQPLDEFRAQVDAYQRELKKTRCAEGVEAILVPGELEWNTRAAKLRDGLFLPEATWQRIVDAGAALGVTVQLDEEETA